MITVLEFYLKFNTKVVEKHMRTFNYNREDYLSICEELKNGLGKAEFHQKGADDMWDRFKNIVRKSRDDHIPVGDKSDRTEARWMTSCIEKGIRSKRCI